MNGTTAYLVDASPYIFRAWFALPETIVDLGGRPASATYGFIDFMIRLLRREDLTHLAVAFDASLTTSFRNDLHPEYKANRDLPPPELEAQLEDCREVAAAFGAAGYVSPRFEADDLLAALHRAVRGDVDRIVLVSSDKDLAQLVDAGTSLFDLARDRWFDVDAVAERFGVRPDQFADYLALTGDAVDNIPGARGIGKKTAAALLGALGSLDRIYDRLDEVEELPIRGAKSIRRRLEEGRDSVTLSRRLVELAPDAIEDTPEVEDLRFGAGPVDRLESLFDRLGFGTLRGRAIECLRRRDSAETP